MHALATSWWGAPILLAAIALPIFHAMHRVYHGLHDLGIHPTKFLHYLLYGFAIFSFCRCLNIIDTNALTTIVSRLKAAYDVQNRRP
jgi:Fumarate reductase subunit D